VHVLSKITALGQARAEVTALQWAVEHGLKGERCCRRPMLSAGIPRTRGSHAPRKQGVDVDATLLLSLDSKLGPVPPKVIEALGRPDTPFLHLWPLVPQPGRLARCFLETLQVRHLHVVGFFQDGADVEAFARLVLDGTLVALPT
jgi:hypothetical protein